MSEERWRMHTAAARVSGDHRTLGLGDPSWLCAAGRKNGAGNGKSVIPKHFLGSSRPKVRLFESAN